jgi:hypothetical protein
VVELQEISAEIPSTIAPHIDDPDFPKDFRKLD